MSSFSMIKYYLLLFLSFSTIYTQEVNDKWLDTILEKNVSVKNSQTMDKEEKQKNNTYFTIQIAAKAISFTLETWGRS